MLIPPWLRKPPDTVTSRACRASNLWVMSGKRDSDPREREMPQPAFSAQVEAFTKEAGRQESWKVDHLEAMACLNLEALVAFGVMAYEAVDSADRKIRTLVAEGKAKVEPDFWRLVEETMRGWVKAACGVLPAIAACEVKGFAVERADTFRALLARAQSVIAARADLDRSATE